MAHARRVALVTGGSRGIGLGIARALARDGLDLVVNGLRGEADVAESLAELRGLSAEVLYVQADVGTAEGRAGLVAAARGRFGRIDVLVNNAGVAPKVRADLLEASEESFDRLVGVNLKGPYFLTQAVARWMLETSGVPGRCIVFVTSISAEVASPDRGDYCLSKAGLAMASQLWAVRLAGEGVGVYEVRPGIIRSDMTRVVTGKYDALIEAGLLLEKRWGLPEDVGRTVATLARGDVPYAPGAVLRVDGGLTVRRL